MHRAIQDIALGAPLVLCYHGISKRWPSHLAVAPGRLDAQLCELLSRGFVGVTFDRAMSGQAGAKSLSVTFDDAYRSVLDLALPVMRGLGVPGTIFAPTGFIGSDGPMNWPGIERWRGTPYANELQCLGWEGLEGLVGAGWEVGSHTMTHPKLTEIQSADEMAEQLGASRELIAERLGGCRTVAYPFGEQNKRVRAGARAAGYTAAAGIRPGPYDRWCWPRVGVYPADDDSRFRLKTRPVFRRLRATHLARIAERARALRRS